MAESFPDLEEDSSSLNDHLDGDLSVIDNSAITLQTTMQDYDTDKLLNEMEGYPCLWNPSTRSHHNQNMRSTAWDQLSKLFGKPGWSLK